MSQVLSRKNKQKFIFSYIVLFAFLTWYIYDINKELQKNISQCQVHSIIYDYKLYIKQYRSNTKNKNFLVENLDYQNNEELIEEYAKSTPLFLDKEKKESPRYSLTIKFFDSKLRHDIDIEKKIAMLKKSNYNYSFKNGYIELFGKVGDDGYVNITKQLKNSFYVKEVLSDSFFKIIIIIILNILVFLYLLSLIQEHEQNKKQIHTEYEELAKNAKSIALVDTLTKASTRLKFDEDLKELITLGQRFEEQIFTFMIIDIDNFKSVNDTYGHDYGDLVLKSVADVISRNIRQTDSFYRWGGEEFVILSPLSDKESSFKFANKLRENIASIKFEKIKQITCSFGLVEYESSDSSESLLKRADELLYKAKKTGKNKVEY